MKLLTIIGTRPEAVKMAPVLLALRKRPEAVSRLCLTGQHQDIARPVLDFFGLCPDHLLPPLPAGRSLAELYAGTLCAVERLLRAEAPDRILVQGDTVSAAAAARAAFLSGIQVAHVEAGLRTYDLARPCPEEMLRREIDLVADHLFAPTPTAAANLDREVLQGRVHVTGNTGIDALHIVRTRLERDSGLRQAVDARLPCRDDRPLLLATVHRRESLDGEIDNIFRALASIGRSGVADIALPLHPNPRVKAAAKAWLADLPGVHLLPSLGPPEMIRLMQRVDLILTDSGGIQEEAPSLGKPVLVLRNETERGEAVAAGLASLIGTSADSIVTATIDALAAGPMPPAANPFGDGKAAPRIVAALLDEAFLSFVPPSVATEPVSVRLVG